MKWFYGARFDYEIPDNIRNFIQNVCNKYNMKYPRVGFIDDGAPNAFTYGHTKNDARIVITRGILELLNEDYKYSHNITENNVLTNIVLDNESVSFNVEEAYYNADSDITYYFLKGYIIGESFLDVATYNDNIYFLIIVDVDDNYVVMPLNNINNLEEYAKNYQIENLEINNNSQFEIVKLDDKNKISNYINKFSDLMFLDSNKAYNMLDVKTKAVYPNIDDFNNNINNIYQNIKTKFNYFEKEEYEDNVNYNVQTRDNDGNTISISIIEYYPYDYKIGFNFLNNY